MKSLNIAILMASAGIFLIAPNAALAQDIERPTLAAEQCQPFSAENADLCCIALNREQLLTAAEIDQCPPLTTARIRDVLDDAGESVIPPGTTVVTEPTDGEPGEEPGEDTAGDTAKPNSGAGNAGETGSGEQVSTDADPGSSGENNSAPDTPPGQ